MSNAVLSQLEVVRTPIAVVFMHLPRSFLSLLAVPWVSLPFVIAADRRYQFDIRNGVVNPDGFARSAILVNGVYPGALITANKGDRLLVNVTDHLTDPTMRRSTSVVSKFADKLIRRLSHSTTNVINSTGMVW